MNGDDDAPPAGSGAQGSCREAVLGAQISEMLDISEMATNIKGLAVHVEVRVLGHSGPHDEAKPESIYDESSPLSLVASMRNYSRIIKRSLQTISDSLNRIDLELGGVGLSEPDDDKHPRDPTFQGIPRP